MLSQKVRLFWNWFQARHEVFRKDWDPHISEISEMVLRIHPKLTWEMGGDKKGVLEFIVRSDDNNARFLAREVIGRAPAISDWAIQHWIPPREWKDDKYTISFVSEIGNYSYSGN